jgi:hypothetical protein
MGGAEVYLHALNLALDGGEWCAPCPDHFTPGESVSTTNRTGQLDRV